MSALRDERVISEIVEETLVRSFSTVRILDVSIHSDVDRDGEKLLHIDVIFDGQRQEISAQRLSGAVRHIRPRLFAIGEEAFPLISFISRQEIAEARARSA